MSIEVTKLKRVFEFKKDGKTITLPDPNPAFSAIEVMKFYSGQYPEITNGFAKGPVVINDKAVFSISTEAGRLG